MDREYLSNDSVVGFAEKLINPNAEITNIGINSSNYELAKKANNFLVASLNEVNPDKWRDRVLEELGRVQ